MDELYFNQKWCCFKGGIWQFFFSKHRFLSLHQASRTRTGRNKKRQLPNSQLKNKISEPQRPIGRIAGCCVLVISLAALQMLLIGLLAHPSDAASLVIQEQPARYTADVVRYPVSDTFMIVPADQKLSHACATTYPASCLGLPVIHFGLGSAGMTSLQKEILLAGLKRCRVSKATPLKITGYTCPLGTRAGNLVLSLLRARTVADLLRTKGYTVKLQDIHGRGQNDLLTHDPKKFALNRRVVISHN